MSQLPRKMSISVRFTLLLFLALLLCALLLSTVASLLFLRQSHQKAVVSGGELLSNVSGQMSGYFSDIEKMAYSLMFNQTTQNVLSEISRPYLSSYLRYVNQNNLYYMLMLQGNINNDIEIAILPLEPNQIGFASDNIGWGNYAYEEEEWYQAFQQDPGLLKQYLVNRTTAYRVASLQEGAHILAYRIASIYTRQTVGYMLVYLYTHAFDSILCDISDSITHLAVINEQNEVVFQSGNGHSAESLLALEAEAKGSPAASFGDSLFLSARIDGPDWRILCTYDLVQFQQDSRRILIAVFLVAIGCCLLCIPLIWHYVRRVFTPVEQLTIGMEWVKMGRLDLRLENNRQDELGQAIDNFNDMTRQLEEARRNLNTLDALQRDIGINALRQQINPHFLYNTLDMIVGMTAEGNQAAIAEVCKALGGMFRYNLNGEHMVSLKNEWLQTCRYAQISKYRFQDRFEVTYEIDETLLNQRVPKLILQPLMENSILHGFSRTSRRGEIRLTIAAQDAGHFAIVLADTGSGMPPQTLQALRASLVDSDTVVEGKNHIGVRYVYQRLHLEYGQDFSMRIESQLDVGTEITLLLPARP